MWGIIDPKRNTNVYIRFKMCHENKIRKIFKKILKRLQLAKQAGKQNRYVLDSCPIITSF